MGGKQLCETHSVSCYGSCHFGSLLILLTYSEISTLEERPQHPVLLEQHEKNYSPKFILCIFPIRVRIQARNMTKLSWEQPSFIFWDWFLEGKVRWILSWPKLTKKSTDDLVSKNRDCPGTNYRYSDEETCLKQREIWSYSLTTVLIDPDICFNEVFPLDQLGVMLIVSLRYHSRSLLCSSISDVKTQLPQHCKGRELNDTEAALGTQVASFVWQHARCFVFSCQPWHLIKLSFYSSSLVPWLLTLWESFNLIFISGPISFTFYIRNLILSSEFLVAKMWQRAFFNDILLLQTVAIILVKLIYYSNYGQFHVCYQVNCCQHPLITVSPSP